MNSCLYFIFRTDFMCRNSPSWDSHNPDSVALDCVGADYNQEQNKLTWAVSYSTFKYMKLRISNRTIISMIPVFPYSLPSALSVSESIPALFQALKYSLEGLNPKTWAADIYLSRNPPAEPFQSLAFLVQQTSCCNAETILCCPSLGQSASQGCTHTSREERPAEAVSSLPLLCNVTGGRGWEAEDGNWADRALAPRHGSSRLSWKGNRAALYSWKELERHHLRFSI